MRVQSKKRAVALRDDGVQFCMKYGDPTQFSSQGWISVDYYMAALEHLANTIHSFDYLYSAQAQVEALEIKLGTLESKNSELASEKRRLEREMTQLKHALRAMKGDAKLSGQPGETNTVSVDPRQEGRSNRQTAHTRKMAGPRSSQGSAASLLAPPQEPLRTRKMYAVNTLPGPSEALLRYLLQGPRNFLDQHSDAGVAGALSFLIQHALTQLQAAPVSHHLVTTQQAMYANLHTISKKLCTYKGQTLNGFQSALEELEQHIPGIEAWADTLPTQKQKRSEAKIFQETLKLLRDQARLEFRPYFYEVDPKEGTVFTVG